MVAAFPVPEISVVPGSWTVEKVTTITTEEGEIAQTTNSYETSVTKGQSTSIANTVSWNNWQEISESIEKPVDSETEGESIVSVDQPTFDLKKFSFGTGKVAVGGLGIASILAQKKKWKILLLEGNNVPGGCCHNKEIGGFEWNTGIDSIGDMDASVGRGIFRPTIDYITGGNLEWAKMPDIHEVSYMDGDRYEWFSTPEKNIEWINKMFAADNVKAEKY